MLLPARLVGSCALCPNLLCPHVAASQKKATGALELARLPGPESCCSPLLQCTTTLPSTPWASRRRASRKSEFFMEGARCRAAMPQALTI